MFMIRFRYEALSGPQKTQFNRALLKRNGSIVDVTTTVTAALGSNTASYLLGGIEQAKSAMFYLIKYLTKDAVALTNCLSIIRDSRIYVEQNPSTAEDTGTVTRGGRYFLQRILNTLNGMDEISDTQAAASLLGMPSSMASVEFQFLFIGPALDTILRRVSDTAAPAAGTDPEQVAQTEIEQEAIELEREEAAIDQPNVPAGAFEKSVEPEEPELHMRDNNMDAMAEAMFQDLTSFRDGSTALNSSDGFTTYGGASIYVIGDRRVPIRQDTHYAYRGEALKDYSFYEWVGLITVQPTPRDTPRPTLHQSRRANSTFLFANEHPLFATHQQRLRSKQVCPVLAGGIPPPYPPMIRENERTAVWHKIAERFARYALVIFCPWDPVTKAPLGDLNWETFTAFMNQLETNGSFRDMCIFHTIENIARGLKVLHDGIYKSR